jgi:Kef-type K+ transport system membrane component KefB
VLRLGVILILCAIAGKLACALGVVDRGIDRLTVAVGMIPRGEVGLIFAGVGASLWVRGGPLLSQGLFSALVLMVLITTLVTPAGLGGRSAAGRPGSARHDDLGGPALSFGSQLRRYRANFTMFWAIDHDDTMSRRA